MRVLTSFFVLCMAFGVWAQSAELESKAVNGAQITFQESSHEFGDIFQGDRVTHTFTYENTGNEPLIISNVRTTCGCTATNWDREPLAPGDTASITVNFNSAGKMNMQNKVVTIMSNAVNSTERIKITANVLPKPADQ